MLMAGQGVTLAEQVLRLTHIGVTSCLQSFTRLRLLLNCIKINTCLPSLANLLLMLSYRRLESVSRVKSRGLRRRSNSSRASHKR